MPTITKNNARLHCRTCLIRINLREAKLKVLPRTLEIEELSIEVTKNSELETILSKYIGCSGPENTDADYPQHICSSCFNQLQQTDKFVKQAQKSAEKLKELFTVNKNRENLNHEEASRDIYKLMLKDSLMETETVLIDDTLDPNHLDGDGETCIPDPFNNSNIECTLRKNIAKMPFSCSESGETDDELAWAPSSMSDLSDIESSTQLQKFSKRKNSYSDQSLNSCNSNQIDDEKPSTRLRVKSKNKLEEPIPVTKRKKRRTKKEMEEFRRKELDGDDGKNKRRQKGTKNSFKCLKCSHCFAHKITLDAHIRKVHEGQKRPFQCDRCDKSYTFIGGLYNHIKEIHEAEVRSYACDFPNCDRIYTSFIAMQKHKRLKHTETGEQKKYVCEQCGATFNQTGNLKYHRRTKHPTEDEKAEKEREKQRYECTVCKKLFHSMYTLKYHTLQLHTNETKYECTICGRKLAKKFMLVQHMLIHSTDKMPCEHCGKQFIRKFELEAHIKAVHMKIKPFECQYCSECFASRKTLRHHEYIHTGEKPYVCYICGAAYRQQTCLKNHRKSHEKMSDNTLQTGNESQSLRNSIDIIRTQQDLSSTQKD